MRKSKHYRCHHKYIQTSAKKKCINGKTPSEKTLENYLSKNIKDLIRGHIRKLEELEARPKDTAGRIEALNKKISRLKDLYINELISLDEYRVDKDRYQMQIEEIMRENQAAAPADLTALKAALDTDFVGTYPTWDDEQKRYFWRSFIRTIRFRADKSIDVIFL
jgi:chromosome segregation ATPase